jgi:HD-GYP domain-containing protein (c-di-GMP phosphodiesterase class II)
MKSHARLGSDALARAIRKALAMHAARGSDHEPEAVRFLRVARTIAHWHHERWDGRGYPDGLAGDAIPLAARLMALADVYDALTTQRVYKAAWTAEATAAYIERESGRPLRPARGDCLPGRASAVRVDRATVGRLNEHAPDAREPAGRPAAGDGQPHRCFAGCW